MTRRRDDETAAKLRQANPRSGGGGGHDGYVSEFKTEDGGSASVTTSESYIVWVRGDNELAIDKTVGGTSYVRFSSMAERDQAVREIAGDHPVYDRDDPNTQINPRA